MREEQKSTQTDLQRYSLSSPIISSPLLSSPVLTVFAWSAFGGFSCSLVRSSHSLSPLSLSSTI